MPVRHYLAATISAIASGTTLLLQKSMLSTLEAYTTGLWFAFVLWLIALAGGVLCFLWLRPNLEGTTWVRRGSHYLLCASLVLFALATLSMHASYRESRLTLSPGESVRWQADGLDPLWQTIFSSGDTESPLAMERAMERLLAASVPSAGEARYKHLVDTEISLVQRFLVHEEERFKKNNIPLAPGQRIYFDNTALVIDFFLKRLELIRTRQPIDLSIWRATIRRFGRWMAGRLFTKIVTPSEATLYTLDKVDIRTNPEATDVLQWSASTSVPGRPQETLSVGEHFFEKGVRVLMGESYSWLLLNVEGGSSLLVFNDDDLSFFQNRPVRIRTVLPALGAMNDKGHVEIGHYDDKNEWAQQLAPAITVQVKSGKAETVSVLQARHLGKHLVHQRPITFVDYFFFSVDFDWFALLAVCLLGVCGLVILFDLKWATFFGE